MKLNITINNIKRSFDISDPGIMLVDFLREKGFKSVKRGCDTGSCGVCTVLMNDKPIPSCSTLAVKAEGKRIITAEGIEEEIEKIGKYLTSEGVDQCGFCAPGFALTAVALKKENPNPTDEEIIHFFAGNLCRCSGYVGQTRAVRKFLEVL